MLYKQRREVAIPLINDGPAITGFPATRYTTKKYTGVEAAITILAPYTCRCSWFLLHITDEPLLYNQAMPVKTARLTEYRINNYT